MKIAILSTNLGGGAGIAALRLHRGLREIGLQSLFVTRDQQDDSQSIEKLKSGFSKRMISAWSKVSKRVPFLVPYSWDRVPRVKFAAECELFSDFRSENGRYDYSYLPKVDIVNIHWCSFFLDLPTVIRKYSGNTPIVFTLHDMNLLTGGCHYDNACERFLTQCNSCPQLLPTTAVDVARNIFESKKNVFSKLNAESIKIVTPSSWLHNLVRSSPIFARFECLTIPNGVDVNEGTFDLCRSKPQKTDHVRFLFLASDVSNPRKGMDIIVGAFKKLRARNFKLVIDVVGKSPCFENLPSHVHVNWHGYVAEPKRLESLYRAADALLLPSRQDNLPNTILESLVNGTPVIAVAVGGIVDAVRPGITGWLARAATSDSMANAIELAIDDIISGCTLRNNCVEVAKTEYSIHCQANQYKKLFDQLLSNLRG